MNRIFQKAIAQSKLLVVKTKGSLSFPSKLEQSQRFIRASFLYAAFVSGIMIYINQLFYHDDAYITLRYVRNFLNGSGIVWNPGEYVQGYSNFLHLILISFLGKLHIDLVLASRIIGFAALAGLFFLMLRFGLNFRVENKRPFWHLPALLIITSVPLVAWSLGGLEGTLFSFLITAGSLLFVEGLDSPKSRKLFVMSGACLGFSLLTRPDGIVFIAVSSAYLLFILLKSEKKSQVLFDLLAFGAALAVIVLPYVAWQVYYYGDIVPNTFYAKTGSLSWYTLLYGFYYLAKYIVHPPFLPALALIGLFYVTKKRMWNNKLLYLALLVFGYISFILYVGGDHMPASRFFLPVIPLMSVILTMVLSYYLVEEQGRTHTASAALMSVALLIFGYVIFTSFMLSVGGHQVPVSRFFLPVVPLMLVIFTMFLSSYILKKQKRVIAASTTLVYLVLLVFGYICFVVYVGGSQMTAYHYFLPLISLMIVIVIMVLSYYLIKDQGRINASSTTMIFLLLATLSLFDFNINPLREDKASQVGTIVGKYIAAEWPEGSLIALSTAGSTPYYAENYYFIDMLGLNDAHIAKRPVTKIELDWQKKPGHLKGDGAYVLARQPDFIIAGPARGTVVEKPWFLSDLELSRIPAFKTDYEMHTVTIKTADRNFEKGSLVFTFYKRVKSKEKGAVVFTPSLYELQ